jgi:hypothetical protein
MILVNSFEDQFGDTYGEGVSRKFGNKASILNHNVVALASFNGDFTTMRQLLFDLFFYYN